MTVRGTKIKRDLLRAACLLAPTVAAQRGLVQIVRVSEDSGDSEDETVRRLVRALHRGVELNAWPEAGL